MMMRTLSTTAARAANGTLRTAYVGLGEEGWNHQRSIGGRAMAAGWWSSSYSRHFSSPNNTTPGQAGQAAHDLVQKRLDEHHKKNKGMSMDTYLSHAGLINGTPAENAPLAPPLDLATTFERSPDGNYGSGEGGNVYARTHNPTRTLLQECMADLELMGGKGSEEKEERAVSCAFSSGMAAVSSLLLALEPPLHVLVPHDVYHGVPTAFATVLDRQVGISYENVDFTSLEAVHQAIESHHAAAATTKRNLLVWMETPSNPLCHVTDIQAVCQLVEEMRSKLDNMKITTVVDSTWAPPCITQPLLLGADAVLHSGTKYLGGHSDVLLGVVTCSPLTEQGRALGPSLETVQTSLGAVASPLECWLTLRGLRTLHVRVERQCQTALELANFLSMQDIVQKVHYPGIFFHPHHEIASQQMRNMYGGMLCLELPSEAMAMAVAGAVTKIRRATSLGGTETLIDHRASIEPPERVTSPPGLLRLSVGLEDADDLKQDLEMALDVAQEVIGGVY